MVSDEIVDDLNKKLKDVLILVLMEYGLWPSMYAADGWHYVLILVLMEYGLWHRTICALATMDQVLILVLMEYGLWRFMLQVNWSDDQGS